MDMKTCSKCGVEKELSEFGRVSKARGGTPLAACKACENARILAWRAANKEKSAAIHARHYRNNIASVTAYIARWRRADSTAHPEKYSRACAAWKAANRDKCNAALAAYKARKKQATPAWANDFFIEEAYDLARRRTEATGFEWQVDHIVPMTHPLAQGLHVENNLQVIPAVENRSKSNRYWPDMPGS